MMKTAVTLVILCSVLLGAHFLRSGHIVPVAVALLTPFWFLLRRKWVPWVLQILLGIGALVWLETLVSLVSMRMVMGTPWGRMAIILAAVIVVHILAVFALNGARVREYFKNI